MKKILVCGATSAIAMECARVMAARGDSFFLVARDAERCDAVARDLVARGAAGAEVRALDLNELAAHAGLFEEAERKLGGLDALLVAHGSLGDQKACERDFQLTLRELQTNFISAASLVSLAANRFEEKGAGTIAVISSVAGDRGRQSNYVYGTAKGALTIFLQGVRNRVSRRGVRVVTIKPGFVDTPMTAGVKKGPLFRKPSEIADSIVAAIDGGSEVRYVPGFWRLIMMIICAIPERFFKRLKL